MESQHTAVVSTGIADRQGNPAKPSYWNGVIAMSFCVFAPIAQDLYITQGMTGLGIAISGAFAVLTSLSIVAIALGSAVGGLLFDGDGYKTTFVASATVLLMSAGLTYLTSRTVAEQGAQG